MPPKVSLGDVLAMDNSLFKNKQVLKPNYTLKSIDDVLHRDDEIRKFYEYVKDVFIGVSPNNVFIDVERGVSFF